MSHLLLVDCDGVLTDGKLNIDHTGEKMFKSFHTRDVRAIRELIFGGFEVTIITADDWGGTTQFASKVGAECHVFRDKREVLSYYQNRPFVAVGDDAWDVPMLKAAKRSYCPRNADDSVIHVPGIQVIYLDGGTGVMAGVLRHLMLHPLC